jgi:hypothetical protein
LCCGRLKWSAWFLNVQTSHLSCKLAVLKGQFNTLVCVVNCCNFVYLVTKSRVDWNCTGIVVNKTICVSHGSAVQFFSPPILIWKPFLFYFTLLINFITDSMKLDFVAVFSDCCLKYIYVLCCSVKVCDTFLQKIYLPFCMADEFGCVINFYFSLLLKMHALPFFPFP